MGVGLRIFCGFSLLGLVTSLLACSDADEGAPLEYGTVSVAVTALGADGWTYRLPEQTYVNLERVGLPHGARAMLDGEDVTVVFDVLTGSYTARLQHYRNYGAQWPLERRAPDAGLEDPTEIVIATLVTVAPIAVVVQKDLTVPVVFSFQVPGIAPIEFDYGSVGVSFDVTSPLTDSAEVEVLMVVTMNTEMVPTEVSGLKAMLTSFEEEEHVWGFALELLGDWAVSWVDGPACIAIALGANEFSMGGPAELLAELTGATGELCFDVGGSVTFEASREGADPAGPFAALEPPASTFGFKVDFRGLLVDGDIYDGRILELPRLVGFNRLHSGNVTLTVYDAVVGVTERWFVGTYNAGEESAALMFITLPPPVE
jgi:hypothetical protein